MIKKVIDPGYEPPRESFTRYHEFKWTESKRGLGLPLLFLGLKVGCDRDLEEVKFKRGRRAHKLSHQTAGLGCNHFYLHGTVLTPRNDDVMRRMRMLSDKWLDSNAGSFGDDLDSVNEYRRDIRVLFGVDCNRSFQDFEEAIYPIDCSGKNISKMASDELPEDLDSLLRFRDGWWKVAGILNRWHLYVLGENGD